MKISDMMVLGASFGGVRGIFKNIAPWYEGLVAGVLMGAFIGLSIGLCLVGVLVIRNLAQHFLSQE
jgi:hypothetical protein